MNSLQQLTAAQFMSHDANYTTRNNSKANPFSIPHLSSSKAPDPSNHIYLPLVDQIWSE